MLTTSNLILPGTLAIREINGRNGPFRVGTLQTAIGDFAIKDPILDQYDEGKYDGQFQIERIYQGHYIAGGRSVTEIRAKLADMVIEDIDTEAPAPIEAEPDPIDTEKQEPVPVKDKTELAPKPIPEKGIEENADDNSLFGLLMPLREKVKLDASVDRKDLRLQIERLGELGYEFDAKTQTWNKPSIH